MLFPISMALADSALYQLWLWCLAPEAGANALVGREPLRPEIAHLLAGVPCAKGVLGFMNPCSGTTWPAWCTIRQEAQVMHGMG